MVIMCLIFFTTIIFLMLLMMLTMCVVNITEADVISMKTSADFV